jgi:hypothetical protein
MQVVDNRITEQQLELLKSFKYLTSEKEISEVKELLRLYYEHKLDAAINKEEADRNYTAEVYEEWLNKQKKDTA